MAARGSSPGSKLLDTHIHFVIDHGTAKRFARRCSDLGVSPSRAGRDALALWLKYASESKVIRAYVADRRARMILHPVGKTGARR
jgi:hypothetical protein